MARIISLTILVTLIIVLGVTFFQVIAPFILPLFLAAVVAIISQPLYRYLIRRTGNHPRIAAGLTTGCVILSVLVPLLVGTFIAAVQLYTLAQEHSDKWRERVQALRVELEIDQLASRLLPYIYGVEVPPPETKADENPAQPATENDEGAATESVSAASESEEEAAAAASAARYREHVDRLQTELANNLKAGMRAVSDRTMGFAGAAAGAVPSVLMALVAGLIGGITFVIALYYFLADGPALLVAAEKLIPVEVDYQRQLVGKFDSVVRAVVLATFMASIGQGLVTASALTVCGFGNLFFIIFVLATFTSLVPLAGVWVVWGPFAIYFATKGDWGSVLFLVAVGGGVAGTMDNVIKTYVLHTDAKLHPLLAFVCILGGLRTMGLWGVFVGPIVASCLHALVKIFNTELKEFSRMKFGSSLEPDESDEGAPRGEASLTQSPRASAPPADAPATKPAAAADQKTRETAPPAKKLSRRMRAAARRKK